jgi:rubredoxin
MILDLGNKTINIRKWKGKDKKKFISSLQKKDIDEIEVMQSLVYDCVEEDVVLSVDEFRYVLSRIRALTLGEEISIDFYCKNCGIIHKETFNLKDAIRFNYKPRKTLEVNDVKIELGDIRNKEFYIKKIAEDEIYDLLLRIVSFNSDNTFTLDELVDKLDELDLDVLDEIMKQYNESKFSIDSINTVTCPECKTEVKYDFDELPGFFPESWFND